VQIFSEGSGTPLVLVPRLEGRWEFMRAAVDELARGFRVLTYALAGEPASGVALDRSTGLDNYVSQIRNALDEQRIDRAVICGVSFGGIAAVRFAAAHPDRVSALILVSTPGPVWHLSPRHMLYARLPWIFGPFFVAETPWRLRQEMAAAFPSVRARLTFALAQLRALARAPISLTRMAERARLISPLDLTAECARITVPTLVITGERHLDHIVPVDGTSEYARLIPGARRAVLERTGHQGVMTRPDAFAVIVRSFVENQRHAAA
jgi:3-oxoadipate enol-lactonase